MEQNKTGKYLKYAIGEIVLVMIGILLALQVNNWNQVRIQKNETSKIHQRIILDIDNDIRELSSHLRFWKEKEPVFKKVINDSVSANLLDEGLSRLLMTNPQTNLNKTGVQQLKTLNVKDELSLRIIEVYDYIENISIIPYEKVISNETKELVSIFQNNYAWFPEWMSKTIMKDNSSKELQDYFLNSMEYRNRVINGNQRIFNNYVQNLEFYIPRLEEIRTELRMINDSDFTEISKKELEQYEGSFKITKIEGEDFNIKVDALFNITAYDNFLRLVAINNPDNFFDFYYEGNESFYYEIDGLNLTLGFETVNSQMLNSYKMIIESNKEKSIHYATKLNVK